MRKLVCILTILTMLALPALAEPLAGGWQVAGSAEVTEAALEAFSIAAKVCGDSVFPRPVKAMAAYSREISAIIPASILSRRFAQPARPGSSHVRRRGRPRKNTASSMNSVTGIR